MNIEITKEEKELLLNIFNTINIPLSLAEKFIALREKIQKAQE